MPDNTKIMNEKEYKNIVLELLNNDNLSQKIMNEVRKDNKNIIVYNCFYFLFNLIFFLFEVTHLIFLHTYIKEKINSPSRITKSSSISGRIENISESQSTLLAPKYQRASVTIQRYILYNIIV